MVEAAESKIQFDFQRCEDWVKSMEKVKDGGL
jgi:hypothetical protein